MKLVLFSLCLVVAKMMVTMMEGRGCGVVMPEKYVYRRIEWCYWWIVTPSGGK